MPLGHSKHDSALALSEYLPAIHEEHSLSEVLVPALPAMMWLPGAHWVRVVHVLEPLWPAYLPTGQARHEALFALSWYLPSAHGLH